MSRSYRSACPGIAENLDFQWDKQAVKIGTALGMESVNKEQLCVCQGNQVQGAFMGGMCLVNSTHRKRMKEPVTYVKTAVQYLNRDTLGTQFGFLDWGYHFCKYCLQLGIRLKKKIQKFIGTFKSQVAVLVISPVLWFKFITKYTLRSGHLFFLGRIYVAFSSTVVTLIFNFRLIFLETCLLFINIVIPQFLRDSLRVCLSELFPQKMLLQGPWALSCQLFLPSSQGTLSSFQSFTTRL